ncbi:MAG: hypothetical protein AAB371_00205 [Patescibacteria group bacterium]
MNRVIIAEKEYQDLKKQAKAYRNLVSKVFESAIKDPISEVVDDFKKTNFYSEDFLVDLENGLRKSSYSKTNL